MLPVDFRRTKLGMTVPGVELVDVLNLAETLGFHMAGNLNGGKGGMHHIAFAVENTDQALADAEAKGIRLIDKTSRGGAEGLKIGFLHPKSTFAVLTELCSK